MPDWFRPNTTAALPTTPRLSSTAPFDSGIADYSKAIELEPKANRYFNRALAYEHKGDKDSAIADYRRGLSIKPNEAEYKQALKRLGASR